jgi:dienelactone hydrolase
MLWPALSLAASLASGAPLDYVPAPFEAQVSSESSSSRGRTLLVRFPSPVKSPFPANDTVWAHLALPPGPGPHPCILVLPVMAAPNIWIERQFIDRFHADGFAVLWLEMPYQFHRRVHPSQPSGQVFLARTAKRLSENFRQSVLDARRALQWLKSRPEIDSERLGIFGISLGAIVGSAVYSVDRAPRYAVFMMGGADFPSLVVDSTLTGPFVKKVGLRPEQVREAWRGIDPVDFAAQNAGKPALLINVRSDTVIPTANAVRLKQAFPDSRQEWLPLGHYTAILHLLWVPRYISRAFARQLGKKTIKQPAKA